MSTFLIVETVEYQLINTDVAYSGCEIDEFCDTDLHDHLGFICTDPRINLESNLNIENEIVSITKDRSCPRKTCFDVVWKIRGTSKAQLLIDAPSMEQAERASESWLGQTIAMVDASDIPEHDVLIAGFPCQPFSIAGVSKRSAMGRAHGLRCEAQGTLFFDIARIIEYHQPRAFLLENVKNLVNHDKGRTFRVIQDTLRQELGYHVYHRVIDARYFVPQHRERIFIVGFREKNGFNLDDLLLPDPASGPKLKTILHPEDGTEEAEGHFTQGKKALVSGKYTLSDHLWNYLQAYAEKHRQQGNGFGFGLCGPDDVARTLSARYYKDGSEILIKNGRENPRRLTPRECARLMGFDKPGKNAGTVSRFRIPVSDTQAYKQFGNAVVVPVVEAVARHMAPWIMDGEAAAGYARQELLAADG